MLIAGDVVVTMDPARRVLEPGWVRVVGTRIEAVGAGPPPAPPDHRAGLVLPGLVSSHQHLVDLLLRGAPVGPTFLHWLLDGYYAGLSRATPDDCGLATAAALAANLAAGVTTVVDCWGIDNGDPDQGRVRAAAEASLAAHLASGGRAVFARMFAEHVPAPWREHGGPFAIDRLLAPASTALDHTQALAAAVPGEARGRVRVTPSPELPEVVTEGAFADALALAGDLGAPLPVHLCASPESRAACGPADLAAWGVLDPRLLAAHCTAVDDGDIAVLAAAGVAVAHCPSSNLALRGAVTPVARFRAAGATVGLGLDNASLNPRADLLAEARMAILAARGRAEPIEVDDVLAMATVEGARAVGLGDEVGSIEVGRRADLVLLDTGGDHWWPHHDWPAALVWQARPADVRTVLVDGRVVVEDGRCTTLVVDQPALAAASARARSAG